MSLSEHWLNEWIICIPCGHTWFAIYPLGADPAKLECSRCHKQESAKLDLEASQEIELDIHGAKVMEVYEGPPEQWICQIDAATGKEDEGIKVIPVTIRFDNGIRLNCRIVGWHIERRPL